MVNFFCCSRYSSIICTSLSRLFTPRLARQQGFGRHSPDGAVSASDGALDVAEGGVDPLESRVPGGLATGSSDDRLVDAAGVADPSEAVQAVTDNGAGGMEIALRQGRDFGTAETLYAAQLQADWLAPCCGFDPRPNPPLATRTPPPLAPLP